jgi:vacuolar iron transporter family protein
MRFDIAIRKGVGFGLTSGIITTLGLMIGLATSTGSRLAVIGGILTIAIADAFSDSLGVHISEEAGSKRTKDKSIWESTLATFFSKLIFALTFLIPVLIFNLQIALVISIIWGLLLITVFSYYIAKRNDHSISKAILEHLIITIIVIILTYLVGLLISKIFGN